MSMPETSPAKTGCAGVMFIMGRLLGIWPEFSGDRRPCYCAAASRVCRECHRITPSPGKERPMSGSLIGQPKASVDTPALLVDLDLMDANIRRVADPCRANGVSWRPHTK